MAFKRLNVVGQNGSSIGIASKRPVTRARARCAEDHSLSNPGSVLSCALYAWLWLSNAMHSLLLEIDELNPSDL